MKRLLFSFLAACVWCAVSAQTYSLFKGHLVNDEYAVFLDINLYEQDIIVPGQEIYGPLPGFLGKEGHSFGWPVVAAEVKGQKALLTMVNDFGSEDLTTELVISGDSLFVLRQLSGSTLKVVNNGKWQKLPKVLPLRRTVPKE